MAKETRQEKLLLIKFIIDYQVLSWPQTNSTRNIIRNWITFLAEPKCMFIVAVQSKFLLGSASPWDVLLPSDLLLGTRVFCMCWFFLTFSESHRRNSLALDGCPRMRIIFGLVWGYTIWANCSGDSFLICCYSLLLGILPWVSPTMITQGLLVVAVLICGGQIREFLPGCWEPAMTLSNTTTVFVVIIELLHLSHELKEMDGSSARKSLSIN